MMLSTKARRVSVGARAGNARRSALRRGCGERFRTRAGKAWPIARGRGPGEPGTHARGAGKPMSEARGRSPTRRMPTPGNSPPGTACAARSVRDAAAEHSAATGPKTVRRKIPPPPSPGPADRGKQRREPPAFRPPEGRPGAVFQGADAREPARAAWLGPANGLAAGLGDRRCGSGNADALGLPCSEGIGKTRPMVRGQGPEKPGTHTRWARNADAGAAAQGNRSPRATRKKSEPASKRRNSIPCPGTFRKRNTLP